MTADEIGVKFTALGKDAIGESVCKKLADAIMRLETILNVGELTALTVKK